MISDLFWHLDDARMSRNLTKLIIVATNISWMYFVLGLYRQSRRYLDLLRLCINKNQGNIPINTEYGISSPEDVLPSLETMIDLSECNGTATSLPEKPDRKIAVFMRRFKNSRMADSIVKSLKASIRKHNMGNDISIDDAVDFASPKMLNRIKSRKESGSRVALVNVEERIASFFEDPKKRAQATDFHESARFFNPASKDDLKFDKVVTLSPMLFCQPASDVGDRVLSAICAP